jgi:uncharacterized protein (DUF2267 family)
MRLEVLDKTLQTTHIWLDELGLRLNVDKHAAWHALGTILRTLRDRLPLGLAAHLGAQLPILIRGIYYDQWQPSEQPKKWRTKEEFLSAASADFRGIENVDPAKAATAVFEVLNHFVDPGQIRNVREALPLEIRVLWPEKNEPLPHP